MVKRSLRGKKTKMRSKRSKIKYLKRTGRKNKSKKRRRSNLKKKRGGSLIPPLAALGAVSVMGKMARDRLTAEGTRNININTESGYTGTIRVNSGSETILNFNITNSRSLESLIMNLNVSGSENQDINVTINDNNPMRNIGRIHDIKDEEINATGKFSITLDNKYSYATSKDVTINIKKTVGVEPRRNAGVKSGRNVGAMRNTEREYLKRIGEERDLREGKDRRSMLLEKLEPDFVAPTVMERDVRDIDD